MRKTRRGDPSRGHGGNAAARNSGQKEGKVTGVSALKGRSA